MHYDLQKIMDREKKFPFLSTSSDCHEQECKAIAILSSLKNLCTALKTPGEILAIKHGFFDREPANDPYIMKVVDRESFQKFLQI